jgi:hypothetical protein
MTFYELLDTGGIPICKYLFNTREGAAFYAENALERTDYTIRMLG